MLSNGNYLSLAKIESRNLQYLFLRKVFFFPTVDFILCASHVPSPLGGSLEWSGDMLYIILVY